MGWLYLFMAGFFEIGFAVSMKLMDGHKNLPWTLAFYLCTLLSFVFLIQAIRTIHIGTAYAVWSGIGGAGAVMVGILYFGDPVTPWRIVFLTLLVSSLVGLKLTSS